MADLTRRKIKRSNPDETEGLAKAEPAPLGQGWTPIPGDAFGGRTKPSRSSGDWRAWPSSEMATQAATWWAAQAGRMAGKSCGPTETPNRWDCERNSHAAMVCTMILDGTGQWEDIPGDKFHGQRAVIDGEIARRWSNVGDASAAEADYLTRQNKATLKGDSPKREGDMKGVYYFGELADAARYCAELFMLSIADVGWSGIRLVIPLSKAQQLSLFGAGGVVNPGGRTPRKPAAGQQTALFGTHSRQWVHPHTRLTESGKVVQVEGHFREGPPAAEHEPESSPALHPLVQFSGRPKPRKPGEKPVDPNYPIREVSRERTRIGGAAEVVDVPRMTDEERRRLGVEAAMPRITKEAMRELQYGRPGHREHHSDRRKPAQTGGESFVAPEHEREVLAPLPGPRKPRRKPAQLGHEAGVEYQAGTPEEDLVAMGWVKPAVTPKPTEPTALPPAPPKEPEERGKKEKLAALTPHVAGGTIRSVEHAREIVETAKQAGLTSSWGAPEEAKPMIEQAMALVAGRGKDANLYGPSQVNTKLAQRLTPTGRLGNRNIYNVNNVDTLRRTAEMYLDTTEGSARLVTGENGVSRIAPEGPQANEKEQRIASILGVSSDPLPPMTREKAKELLASGHPMSQWEHAEATLAAKEVNHSAIINDKSRALWMPAVKGHEIAKRLLGMGYAVQSDEHPDEGKAHYTLSKVPEGKVRPVNVAHYHVDEAGNVEVDPLHKTHGPQGVADVNEAARVTKPKPPTFDVGETAIHTNSSGDRAEVNYRGSTGDGKAVVVVNGYQMTVPEHQLSKK